MLSGREGGDLRSLNRHLNELERDQRSGAGVDTSCVQDGDVFSFGGSHFGSVVNRPRGRKGQWMNSGREDSHVGNGSRLDSYQAQQSHLLAKID